MAKIELTLNGEKITTEDNQTILELAKSKNLDIPTLCKDPRLPPITSCYVCVVEVKGAKSFVPSCGTYVSNGMEIQTHTPEVISARKTALELILSNHTGDCIAPCKLACPAGCDIQGYVGLIANGQFKEAIKLIKKTIPLPAAIGRVCPRFCEEKCRRQFVDKSVSIDDIKRYVADMDLSSDNPYMPEIAPKIGRKVAIVGGGPAGLSSAYYLTQYGVDVEIFEAKENLGGMIYYGVPDYRLPKEVTTKEIKTITDLGIKIHTNKKLGRDFNINDLKSQNFDAIVLALGAWKSRAMGIPNEEVDGVYDGIKYLEKLNEGKEINLYGRVAIVGGGNTAFDCARTALRIGAFEVVIVYRRTREEMPANEIEIIEAEEEGIKFQFLTAPVHVIHKNNRLTGIECIKMKLGEPDSSGRRSPVPIENSNYIENFDFVITAIGQSPDYSNLLDYKEKLLKGAKWIDYNKDTGQTSVDYIFIAGDYATGPATVVEALAGGKKASDSILKFLRNEKLDMLEEFISKRDENNDFEKDYFNKLEKIPRQVPDVLNPEIRRTNFDEIVDVFTDEQVNIESNRCIECGCMDVHQCDLKKYSDEYQAKENTFIGDFNLQKDDNSHTYIYREPQKCILCGRCVQLCKDKINIGVYGFVKRGFDTIVNPPFDEVLTNTDCISCGACISGCPVGAIVPKTLNKKKIPLKGIKTDSVCFHCSIGCKTSVETLSNTIYEIHERSDYLCEKGKFKFPVEFPLNNNDINYEILNKANNAIIYPSPSLNSEDYEALKIVSEKMNWKISNYYSQSTLWQAFSSIKSLPKMDFFTKELTGKSLVITAGNIENNHPIAINRLSQIINNNMEIIHINKIETLRLKNLNANLITNPLKIDINVENYNEIVLLINPIDFDSIFGKDSALKLYNNLAGKKPELRTTLFSNARNLYSFYDAENIVKEKMDNSIFIKTIPDTKSKKYIWIDSKIDEKILPVSYSFQSKGTHLNSKNEYYINNPILQNNMLSISEILISIHKIKEPINILKHKNIEKEIPFKNNFDNQIIFPKESLRWD